MKIITLFSLSPGSRFNRKQIQEKVHLFNIPLDISLLRLLNSGILKRERNFYSIDFENQYSKKILEICSKQFKQLKELPLNVYYMLTDLAQYFSATKGNEIILFGSFAKLTYTVKSDVDVALLYVNSPDKSKISSLILKLKKIYVKNIEIHYFEKKSFYKNKRDPLVKSILKDEVKIV